MVYIYRERERDPNPNPDPAYAPLQARSEAHQVRPLYILVYIYVGER